MKTAFAAIALILALAGAAQAGTQTNGGLPNWAEKALNQIG